MTSSAAPVGIGEVLAGKYRVDGVLGSGGMGVVVAATHVHLDQRVAIKFLLPQALANPEVVARFQREARAAVKIHSEHVARVIDVGTLETGAPYMVMEYLEGTDLAHRIAAGPPLGIDDAVRFLLEACEALAEAHAAGIVHRDVKPANLFLAKRPDRTLSVKVLDFGISKAGVGGIGQVSGGITSTQAVMGSPYYMSPEQLMSAKNVDSRSDIWALGIVLYEALVGTPPYQGDSLPEIVAQILQGAMPRVSAHRADVPAEVDAVVARCLAKEPSARFRDVGELATALAKLSHDGARSVERISRILGESVRPSALASTNLAEAPAAVSDGRGGTVAIARMTPSQQTPVAPMPATTSPTWTSSGLPQKRTGLWIGVAAGCVVLGLGAVVVAKLAKREPASSPTTGIAVGVNTGIAVPNVPTIPAPPPPPDISSALGLASDALRLVPTTTTVNVPPPRVTAGTHVSGKPVPSAKPSATVVPTVTATAVATTVPTATATSKLNMVIK